MPKSLGHGVTGSVRKFQVWQSEQDVVIQEICLLGTLKQKLEKVLHVVRAGEIQTKMIQEQSNRVYVRCDVGYISGTLGEVRYEDN